MAKVKLPSANEPIVLSDGRINPVWYRLLDSFVRFTSGQIIADAGAAAAPAYAFRDDADTGIYREGDGLVGIAVNGTRALSIGPDGLSIGDSNPDVRIVAGDTPSAGTWSNVAFSFVVNGVVRGAFDTSGDLSLSGNVKIGSTTVIGSDRLVQMRTATVAALPTGSVGKLAFATNGRKSGEGAGSGSGVLVFHDGTNWRAVDTGLTVQA